MLMLHIFFWCLVRRVLQQLAILLLQSLLVILFRDVRSVQIKNAMHLFLLEASAVVLERIRVVRKEIREEWND